MKRKIWGTAVAGLVAVLTLIGNINDIVSFFQLLIDVFEKMSFSSRVISTILLSLVLCIFMFIFIYVYIKYKKNRRAKQSLNNFIEAIRSYRPEDEAKDFVKPFLSESFDYLLASASDVSNMHNAESLQKEGIEVIEYEAALAKKIARADDPESCRKSFEVLHDVLNSWTVFLNEDKQIISYWIFISLKKDAYDKVRTGIVNEKDIGISDIDFIDLPGRYWGYLLLAGTSDKCKTQKNRAELYDSWLKHIETLAERGIFFYEISTMVGSAWGNSSLQTLEMEYQGEYRFGGKMYRYNLKNIENINYLIRYYPKLVEYYKNEFAK